MESFIHIGNEIEDKYGKVWYKDGIMYASYYKGVVVSEEIARLRTKYRKILSGGKKVPAFVYGNNVVYWTRSSKRYANSKEGMSDLVAAAVYYDNRVFKIIVDAGLLVFPPSIPVKSFSNEEKGKEWLKKFLNKENNS